MESVKKIELPGGLHDLLNLSYRWAEIMIVSQMSPEEQLRMISTSECIGEDGKYHVPPNYQPQLTRKEIDMTPTSELEYDRDMEGAKNNLRLIHTTDNHSFIGVPILNEDKSFTMKHCIGAGNGITREIAGSWMKKYNLQELKEYDLRGDVGYRIRELTRKERQWFEEAWYNMVRAIRFGRDHMHNTLFDLYEKGK